ncbi:MAG: tripartite tricarboxylate transporter TctB family protein [Natronohydrobacter sp.]|nr:tripartite tricarboxylate transporter TctB family protein [Natronohydrobacter sp.]
MFGGRVERADAPARAPVSWRRIVSRLALPGGFLALGLILPAYMFDRPLRIRARGLGPDAWPGVFLNAIAVIALLWIIAELWALYAEGKRKRAMPIVEQAEAYDYSKAAAAICLLLAFGWLLPTVGFPIAATLFILCWCFLGGIRNPVALLLVSLLGMLTLLWVFMGLALMPLSRGTGVFDDFSVWFLRFVRIY